MLFVNLLDYFDYLYSRARLMWSMFKPIKAKDH